MTKWFASCPFVSPSIDSLIHSFIFSFCLHWFTHHWFIHFFVQVSKVEFLIHRWFSHLPFNYSLIPSSLFHSLSPLKNCIWDSSLVHSFIIHLFIDLFIIDSIILIIHHSNVGFEYHRWFIHPSFNYSNPVHHCVHSFGTQCFTTFQRIPWRRDSNILIIHLSNVEFEYHH